MLTPALGLPVWDWILEFNFMMTSSNGNISALLAICAGNSPAPGEFPAQRPVPRSFDVVFDLCQNKRLSKEWWFETPSCPLWRHRNVEVDLELRAVAESWQIKLLVWSSCPVYSIQLSCCHLGICIDVTAWMNKAGVFLYLNHFRTNHYRTVIITDKWKTDFTNHSVGYNHVVEKKSIALFEENPCDAH